MSSSNSGARVSIPSSVRKTIQNIKEINGNHSEEEIYAMLKECNMDPNETAQRLLFQDTFHEVRRKRDRRRENLNKESADPKWKPVMQGRGSKGSRGNFNSRLISHDAGGRRNSASGKENGASQVSDKSVSPTSVPTVDARHISSSPSATANGPGGVASESDNGIHDAHASAGRGIKQPEGAAGAASVTLEGQLRIPTPDEKNSSRVAMGTRDMQGKRMPNSSNSSTSLSLPPSSGAYFSASDPVLLPSHDSRPLGAVGTIRREVGSQRAPLEPVSANSNGSKTTSVSDSGSATIQLKIPNKLQGHGKNHLESSQSATQGGASLSRPSSNYNNRSAVVGTQKAGPGREWKPKPTNSNPAQGSATAASSSDISIVSAAVNAQLQPPVSADVSAVTAEVNTQLELQKKLEESHISDVQHVIIPNHLHVPEAEKLGFCFGSFDASLGLGLSSNSAPENDKSPPLSENSQDIEETSSDQFPSDQNASTTAQPADGSDQSPPSSHGQENLSSKADDMSSSVPEYSEPKQETLQGGHQYSVVHTSPNYSFGFVPPMLGSPLAPFENSESQPRDVSRLPNFVAQQPIDPASYYAQFYRPSSDGDGRISPFHSAGVSIKYNGGVAAAPPQTSQSSQEGGNPLSTAASTPLVTQAAGLMQSSLSVNQQPLPVFRQAAGMHMPHYPPNYIPYTHYFSPYYVPPTAIHQFLSNGAFPQQPQAGSVYPPPPPAAAKYSLSQYKPGANLGNSPHLGVPGTYGPYGSTTANYNPSSATTAGNPAATEDISASQFKENNVYVSGQQSEGSGVWITAPSRDLSSLQAGSFYNIPQGQMAFTPTQPGHGGFSGLYHPGQPMTAQTVHPLLQHSQTMAGPVDMVGPTANVYQQPQHSQINWPNGY